MIFPVERGRTKAPEKKPFNPSWMGALSAVAALVAVLLWFRGYIYRSIFFDRLGLSVDQFPMSYPEIVTIGVTSWLEGLFYGLLTMVAALFVIMIFVVAWRSTSRRFFDKLVAENTKRPTKDASILLVDILIRTVILTVALFACFLMVLLFSHADGEKAAKATLAKLSGNECPKARGSSPTDHMLIERTVLGPDGKEKTQREEGMRVMCSEKFCAYLMLTSDKKAWQSKIVPLEKITRFESCEILLTPIAAPVK